MEDVVRKELEDQFKKALDLIDGDLIDKEIVEMLNRHNPKKKDGKDFISKYYFSKFRSPQKYIGQLSVNTLKKIVLTFNKYISENYHKQWNNSEKRYESFVISTGSEISSELFSALQGVWLVYSWDASTTKKSGIGHIHFFKVHLVDNTNIICTTKKTELRGNKMILIGTDKVTIELNHPLRKIFLMISIGNAKPEDLKKENSFSLAYIDSGNQKVKAGLAIIERTNQDFNSIIPESKPVSAFENTKESHVLKFLLNTQLVIE